MSRTQRRTSRRYSRRQARPSMFWGRALTAIIIVLCIWAWAKGQHA